MNKQQHKKKGCRHSIVIFAKKDENSRKMQVADEIVMKGDWHYRLISEVIADYIFVLDIGQDGDLKVSWASENLLMYTGRKPGEILTMEVWKTIVHPDDLPGLLNFIQQMLTNLEKGKFECRSFHKDGHERWVSIFARKKTGPDGKPSQIIGAVREITEQKQTEQDLLYSEQKYRKLHSTMTDAFCSVNMKGEMQEFNESYCRILGYSEDELLKVTYVDLTPEKWHAMEARIVEEEILPNGSSGIYEKEYIRKDGKIIPVELRTFLVRDESGKPSAMWAIVRDISERKLAEEKLQAALKEKETLLREVHHRVKNNLQTVITLIQMRSPEIKDEVSLRIISELQEQVRTISVIYQELFHSERLSRVSMQPYLELLTSYLLKTFHKGNHLKVEVDCRETALDANWAMTCGLIVNELVTNALKYAFPEEFKEIPLISVHLSNEGNTHTLTVTDNGAGMSGNIDIQNPSTIGLQLVNLWVKQQMKGKLDVNSSNGTVITITFNIADLS
ncbi:MAG: PAS domain S-box protein [Bacteroidota bacterium]|jgi:PAS domain S-box-containing protein